MDHGIDDINHMLSQSDKETLVALLLCGADTPHNISRYTGRHKQTIQKRLSQLEEEGWVRNKGAGVYDLTYEGFNSARIIYLESDIPDKIDCGK